jgi:hypothetical protein
MFGLTVAVRTFSANSDKFRDAIAVKFPFYGVTIWS